MDKRTIVTRIDPNGERSPFIYVNNLSPRENMITTVVSEVLHSGNILDKRLRQKAADLLQETPHSYLSHDTEGNYYWVRK